MNGGCPGGAGALEAELVAEELPTLTVLVTVVGFGGGVFADDIEKCTAVGGTTSSFIGQNSVESQTG